MHLMSTIDFKFANKYAVVTGGAQGIGFTIAKNYLTAGASVSIWDYSQDALDVAKKELSAFADRVDFQNVDVTKKDSCEAAANALGRPIDILVNNAGITRDKSFKKMSNEDWDAVIQTNLTGLFNVTKSLFEKFNENSANRRIINMASVVALYGNFGQTNYVATKAGVIGMTKTWAREFARKGFTVNAIAPGFIETAMTAKMPAEVLDGMKAKVPSNKLGQTDDIANACLFLSSDEAQYINGATISVDGGVTI